MASWTDGAAYAPIERPDGFATPEVEPLEHTEPPAAPTPGPLPYPSDFLSSGPARPLSQVAPDRPRGRDPSTPFLVSAGLLTSSSSLGTGHRRDPRMPYRSHAPQPVEQPPPPTGDPLPAPVRMSPQDRSTQKTLVFLALALTVLAFTIPAAAPLLLSLAGVITWRTTRLTGRAGYWCVGAGLGLMVFGGILGPEIASVLARLTAAGFLAWFGLAAYKRL